MEWGAPSKAFKELGIYLISLSHLW